ncbi:ABC transporter domain-containing protein [Plasmodiophora brassicae]
MRSDVVRRALLGGSGLLITGLVVRQIRRQQARLKKRAESGDAGKHVGKDVVGLNRKFTKSLRHLMRIAFSDRRAVFLLTTQAGLLFSRTIVSILVARMDGAIVQALVSGNKQRFFLMLQWWLLLAVPATTINAFIRCLQSRIALHVRTKLTHYVLDRYLRNDTYYKLAHLDSRIQNADQLITVDIERFSSSLSELYSNLAKPFLDLILFGTQLAMAVGWIGPVTMGSFYVLYGLSLPVITPPFGRLAAEEGRLEGEYRAAHARLITSAEEIAFYKGEVIEKSTLLKHYRDLVVHVKDMIVRRIGFGIIEGFTLKYVSSATGLIICAIPVFWSGKSDGDGREGVGERTADYTRNRRYLLNLADAITRILSSTKEIGELAGYTSRVMTLLETLEDVNRGVYQKVIPEVNQQAIAKFTGGATEFSTGAIEFDDVPIITPNGDLLVSSMSMVIDQGMNLLITGPNGCGKSSLFRILGGLWPVMHGTLRRPMPQDLFYIPQRPYLSSGTFRDQIIYPDTVEMMRSKGATDDELYGLLGFAHLQYVLDREGGWDSIRDWKDVLSGGEKQRVAMARLFYHKPRYAILDECTSQVSIDVEGLMYTHATELGISLMTVSHRPSLWQYHNYVCQFDGDGGVEIAALDVGHRMSLEEEKANILKKLSDVPHLNKRLDEIALALGEVRKSASHLDLQEHLRRASLPESTAQPAEGASSPKATPSTPKDAN